MSILKNVVLRIEIHDSIEYYVLFDRQKNVPLGRIPTDININIVRAEDKLTPMERAVYNVQSLESDLMNNPDDGSWEGR